LDWLNRKFVVLTVSPILVHIIELASDALLLFFIVKLGGKVMTIKVHNLRKFSGKRESRPDEREDYLLIRNAIKE
jgi:hypothetical protein